MWLEFPMFQSLNWQAQVLLAREELNCGLPLSKFGAAISQQRAVESLPLAGPPELGTQIVVGLLEPLEVAVDHGQLKALAGT